PVPAARWPLARIGDGVRHGFIAGGVCTGRGSTLPNVTSGPPSDRHAGPRGAQSDNGGFFYRRDDPAAIARLREVMGEEALARWQRSIELSSHPRPLTDPERAVLRQAVAPLLADLPASSMSLPDIREEAHEDREAAVCGWIQRPGGTGEGIWV